MKICLRCTKHNVDYKVYVRELNEETMNWVRICLSNKDYDRIEIEYANIQ